MKRKTLYIFMIICGISLLASARQNGKKNEYKSCCWLNKTACEEKIQSKTAKTADVDLPPMRLLMFGI